MAITAAPPARRGRPSQVDDLRLELRAAGQDMRAAGHALLYADRVGRRDLTLHTAAQLISRGERYARS
jgi:hypothetical protein